MLPTLRAPSPSLRSSAPVHCFQFEGRRFGYFPRTADLVALTEPAHLALAAIEAGESSGRAVEQVTERFGPEAGQRARADLSQLEEHGYLRPEVELGDAEKQREWKSLLMHQPRNLMFFVTEACNLKCTYCYELNQGVHASPAMLKQVDAHEIIDRYFGSSGRDALTITFFGGEPLLNFKVVRDSTLYALQKGKELGRQVGFTMTTNLTLLTEEIADFLAEHQFHVMVSLDGDREGNDRYRRTVKGEGTYDTVVANLRLLIAKMRAAGVRLPKIRATLTAENSDPVGVEEHLRSLGTHLVEIGDTHGTVAGGVKAFDVNSTSAAKARAGVELEVARILEELEREPSRMPHVPHSIVRGLQRIHEEIARRDAHDAVRPKLCGVCRNMKAVTPKGDLYPCHRYVGMEAFRFGNIHEGGLDREKERRYYSDIYSAFAEKCVSCWARHLCGGQCPWYLSRPDGSVSAPDDASCDSIRAGLQSRMGLYAVLLESFPEAFRALMATDPATLRGDVSEGAPDLACRS
jgi:uncharacterized protein